MSMKCARIVACQHMDYCCHEKTYQLSVFLKVVHTNHSAEISWLCADCWFFFFFSFHAVQNMKATSATTSIQDMLAAPFQTSYFDVSGLGDVQLEKVYFTAIPNQEHLVLNAVFFLIYRVMDPQEKYSNGKQNQGVNICSHWYC